MAAALPFCLFGLHDRVSRLRGGPGLVFALPPQFLANANAAVRGRLTGRHRHQQLHNSI
jgi:hypothetical protein